MNGGVRRIVTGHNDAGESIVLNDGLAPNIRINPNRPGHYSTDIWRTNESPAIIRSRPDEATDGPRRITPNKNGSVVRISTIPPDSAELMKLDVAAAQNIFRDMGDESASTFARAGKHPLIHRTQTVDYAIVLEGELFMVLDTEDVLLRAGDVVVQLGTSHAWSNRSSAPAKLAFVLIDGKFEDGLAEKFCD